MLPAGDRPLFRRHAWLAGVACIAVFMNGCGFHLRGSGQHHLTIRGLYVEGSVSDQLIDEVSKSLEEAGATLAAHRKDATYILNLKGEQTSKNVLTVGPGGKVLEYELHYAVTFEAMDGTGRRLIPPQRVSVVRDVTFNESAALGKANEEQRLYGHLHREVIGQIIRRLQSKLSQ